MKYSGACTENFQSTLELPRQQLTTDRTLLTKHGTECIRESRIDPKRTHLPLQAPSEHIIAPEDAMQIDMAPDCPPASGYQNEVTAMDVFSRF